MNELGERHHSYFRRFFKASDGVVNLRKTYFVYACVIIYDVTYIYMRDFLKKPLERSFFVSR